MNIYSDWYDKSHNIVLQTHSHDWAWEDLLDHDTYILPDLLATATGPAALIIDMTRSNWLPDSDEFIDHIKAAGDRLRYCNVDITMFVISQEEIGSVLALAYRHFAVSGRKYYFTETVEDAYNVIFEHRGIATQ